MKQTSVKSYLIEASENLDPIHVYVENFGTGVGQITITCYGEAWTAWWGAMGKRTVERYFVECDDLYLANRLMGPQFQKRTSGHTTYLRRIVRKVQEELKRGE